MVCRYGVGYIPLTRNNCIVKLSERYTFFAEVTVQKIVSSLFADRLGGTASSKLCSHFFYRKTLKLINHYHTFNGTNLKRCNQKSQDLGPPSWEKPNGRIGWVRFNSPAGHRDNGTFSNLIVTTQRLYFRPLEVDAEVTDHFFSNGAKLIGQAVAWHFYSVPSFSRTKL